MDLKLVNIVYYPDQKDRLDSRYAIEINGYSIVSGFTTENLKKIIENVSYKRAYSFTIRVITHATSNTHTDYTISYDPIQNLISIPIVPSSPNNLEVIYCVVDNPPHPMCDVINHLNTFISSMESGVYQDLEFST